MVSRRVYIIIVINVGKQKQCYFKKSCTDILINCVKNCVQYKLCNVCSITIKSFTGIYKKYPKYAILVKLHLFHVLN